MVNSIPSNEPISEAEALERLSQQDDPSLQCYGAWWLGRMRSSHPEAIPLLLNCLNR
ncbi:MAG: HEAT repeat domain-containing protein, partial [Synechococcaceae bacterium WB6_3A_227]|nr:HEAT repeat domain-containing protein [Synechococcaceae bacterium WB6_3A_227]